MKIKPFFKTQRHNSRWIISLFPDNYREYDYLEPFVGSGCVFLNKERPKNKTEIINDIDDGIVCIFRALRDEPDIFINKIKKINFSEDLFLKIKSQTEFKNYMEKAVNEFLIRGMSRGGLKKSYLGNIHEDISGLQHAISRLNKVYIFKKKALDVIAAFDNTDVLIYCDPPHIANEGSCGPNEMSTDDHIALATALHKCQGKVIISGFSSPLYNRLYKDWRNVEKTKSEVCWINF